ncbi:heparanase-like protein 2 isoform X1 [Ziziphus jujuba]|uniref:Heparanase-like protein 2 isoform X1 n=2 Tax=Ziziphus jujuba TaxID=326968 RepID=A0A6P4AJ52_ZIZJJ|nr:heparanase-like protein 2 isoform X1 [Ziziphus jujuba]
MELRVVFCCFLVPCFSLCFADNIEITIRGETSIAETDDNFICATLDWWPNEKCDYNDCSWIESGILNMDLKNKVLSNAIKAFNSLRIRVGGSLEDQVVYGVGNAAQEDCPEFTKTSGLFGFSNGCLPQKRWDELNHLFNETGAKMTFGLNALYGRKQSQEDKVLWVGKWNPQNARELMEYTISKGYMIDSYELGNELCGSGISARVESEQYGKDMIELKNLVKELYPDTSRRPKVLGPGGFYDEKWFNTFLQVSGPDVVDGLTHHIYNLGAGVDRNLINNIQDPYYLNQIAQTYADVSRSIKDFGPWAGAWVGESGGAYNSGGKNVSHTFVDGFWYLDQLGMTSTFNHKVFCRQTLVGGNYGLLSKETFIPNPDYYGALLWHRLMGKKVLSTKHEGSPYLRAYSHCSRNHPGVTLLLINMSNSTYFDVSVENDFNLYPEQVARSIQREEYHLTPKDGDILSDVVVLNGTPLKLTDSLGIPNLEPVLVDGSSSIRVVPDSFVFVVLKDFKAATCA